MEQKNNISNILKPKSSNEISDALFKTNPFTLINMIYNLDKTKIESYKNILIELINKETDPYVLKMLLEKFLIEDVQDLFILILNKNVIYPSYSSNFLLRKTREKHNVILENFLLKDKRVKTHENFINIFTILC